MSRRPDPHQPRPITLVERAGRALKPWRVRLLVHRRAVAAACAGISVWCVVHTLSPAPPTGVDVLVAARDLPAGTVLEASDLRTVSFAEGTVPDEVDPRPTGRTLASPVTRGEPLTAARLAGPGLGEHLDGRQGVPVRVADADVVRLLRVGDRVDVAATDPRGGSHERLATGAVVIALPVSEDGASSNATAGRLVLLGVRSSEADAVLAASASEVIHLVWTQEARETATN